MFAEPPVVWVSRRYKGLIKLLVPRALGPRVHDQKVVKVVSQATFRCDLRAQKSSNLPLNLVHLYY